MADTKPFASLSSGLLARKGGAKPAMRPQGFGGFGGAPAPAHLEDLGWNDMGHSPEPEHVPSSIEGLTPSPAPVAAPEPVVVEQQRVLKASFPVEAEVVTLPRSRAGNSKGKAAFTLRLDPERHLKLRLACAVTHRSAQQLVTEALDRFLSALPELDGLSNAVAAKAGKRN